MTAAKPGKAAPVTPAERKRIVALIEQGISRNAIMKATGRSAHTVSKIAREIGFSFSGREQVVAATVAKQRDNASKRAEITEGVHDQLLRLLTQMNQPHSQKHVTPSGQIVVVPIGDPDSRDWSNYTASIAKAAAAIKSLTEIDRETSQPTTPIEEFLARAKARLG